MNLYELSSDECLITSQIQFLDKLNELISNGYYYIKHGNLNLETLLLDVANWGAEDFKYEKILSKNQNMKTPIVDILFFKINEENKLFEVCAKRFNKIK